ncbi:hypothetical protein GE21DRAFT_5957 [Neurospora crassa]|uniref:Early conidial development-1 protein n=1 Tax=Neurospora crassa (strain ATCC 24698 / 74-OR23-1A / CBS 708.71 / DSM 1257 / FGSC 987) TaxID=367110 RepID=Q7SAC8_NEUCR|nr:early conidial development-1 protein [Neurospora crassa OR74A]EAA33328.2 early conidial development-1 protein [Neurospora crassa OR74A]KHE83187.1 hypothetical protein GE21DRAFT_5957 [Neurospora crassa]|eukprot:XP_962564.2 early conidial development-1 protein [Neurospora crassa OR74A]
MDSLLDQQEPLLNDTDPFLRVYRYAITLHPSPLLSSRYTIEPPPASPRTSSDTPTKQTPLPPSLASNDFSKQTPGQTDGHEDNKAESRVLVPRRGASNIPATAPRAVVNTPQRTVTVTLYAANHKPYEVPIKFYNQQSTRHSRLEQIWAGQMQGGPELLSWIEIVRHKLFAQIPGFVFVPQDPFLSPIETVNLLGGLTDQRDDTQALSQLTAKFLREYFANMSMEDRPVLYSQAQKTGDGEKLVDFHKESLHDIFFSIQVHRRKGNKNIVGDHLKGPHPLVARAAKEKYIQEACFPIHPHVMKKVVQHVVEARKAYLLKKQDQAQTQAPPHVQSQLKRSGSMRTMKSCVSLKANDMNNNSIRRMKSHASLKDSESTNVGNNIIIPLPPIPTEDWGCRDPHAWLVGWDLEMESLAYMRRSSDFPRLGKVQERQLVLYQFARSVDEWMWRLEQAEKNAGCGLGLTEPEKVRACEMEDLKDTEELLIEL